MRCRILRELSATYPSAKQSNKTNSRAENGQTKRRQRQTAQGIILVVRIVPRIRGRAKAAEPSVRPRQDSDGDEAADEQYIEEDQ